MNKVLTCPLLRRQVLGAVAVLGQGGHARCCERQVRPRIGSCSSWTRTCPLCPTTGALGFKSTKLWRFRSCSSSTFLNQVVDIPVVVQREIPHGPVQEAIEILQLQYTDKVIDVPVVPVQFPSAGVEKTAELPHCSRRVVATTGTVSRIRSSTCPLACNDRCISCSSWTRLTCQLLCNAKCAVSPAWRRR